MALSELLFGLAGLLLGSGPTAIALAVLNRKWQKQDKLDAIIKGQKLIMMDRVRFLGKQYIANKGIALEDKENLVEMHKAYKALGGNGHLDTVMEEVDHLPILG
jgi:hypothetical protein